MLKGMTAQYLLRRTYKVGPDTTLLFHAAAGGVGMIACQWAASLGATVIGTVGSAGKALIARSHGCTHVINYREEDVVAKVKDYTKGEGVDVVYDFDRQGYVPGLARLPEAARHVGELRPGVGAGAGVPHQSPGAEGLAVRHAAHARRLYRHAQGARRHAPTTCSASSPKARSGSPSTRPIRWPKRSARIASSKAG